MKVVVTGGSGQLGSLVLERLLESDSPVRYQMKGALTEITAAAESMRLLLDYLQMHPEALLSGKDAKGK